MALCEVYRPYRGLGSDVPSRCTSSRKRKAHAVRRPEAPTRARRRRRQLHGRIEEDDDAMSFAQILESELLSYFETENTQGGEPAAPQSQDKPNSAAAAADDVMEISLDEFLGSSAAHAVPLRAAQLESAAAEFSSKKLMLAASSPKRSSTPSALTDDDDMCGLACPPMDDAYVELIFSEPLVHFDPAFIKEFISDP